MALSAGTRLGPYEILAPLGAGGMGEVYRAKDTKLGREVALKVLPEEFAKDPSRLKRFEQEARSASALNHPNIITVYDIDEHDSTPYIAMEYVEGQTLREVLIGGPIPTKKLIHLATQMAEGLAKAHSAGIVHRDLKPENVMVTGDGFVKILDFGLAKLTHQTQYDSFISETRTKELTREGVIVGTLGYMSPEQASGRAVDHRSDQFSFGAVLYEMATGDIAFKRGTAAETLAAIIEGKPRPIARINPKVPAQLRVIVERCLSKEPGDRYESTRDLAKELERFREIRLEPPAFLTRRTALAGLAALSAVGLTGLLGLNVGSLRDRLLGEAGPSRIDSLAVLPLENLSGDPGQEYFVDGITEALITDLAKISALKVIARNSAMRYKDTDKSIAQIAEELGVHAVISGSVLRSGDRVRVTAQLIEAETDQYLWAESFDRELRDILALYSDVARAIAQEIEVAMTPGEKTRLASTRRVDPEAFELYVQGRHHLNRRPNGLEKANKLFQQAVETDPSFPQAHAALSYSYILLRSYSRLPPDEALPKAKAAALKAQEMDDTLAETQKALVFVKVQERDWPGVDRAMARVLEISPGDPEVHNWNAQRLSRLGRHDEAIAAIRKAWELDPNAPVHRRWVGRILYWARRYDEAIEHLRQMIERQPDFSSYHFDLTFALLKKGMVTEATEEAEKHAELTGLGWGLLGYAYAAAGRSEEAREILRDLEEEMRGRGMGAAAWRGIGAAAQAALGDEDVAFAWLDKAYEMYDPWLFQLQDPIFDPLRDDPRFYDLLQRLNNPYRPPAGETTPDKGTAS